MRFSQYGFNCLFSGSLNVFLDALDTNYSVSAIFVLNVRLACFAITFVYTTVLFIRLLTTSHRLVFCVALTFFSTEFIFTSDLTVAVVSLFPLLTRRNRFVSYFPACTLFKTSPYRTTRLETIFIYPRLNRRP